MTKSTTKKKKKKRNPVHPTKPKTQSYLGNSFRVKHSISMVDRWYWEVLRLKKTMHSLGPHWLGQCSPTFLTPGTGFVEDSFPMDWGRGNGLDFTCCLVHFLTDHGPLPVCSPGLVTPGLEEKQQRPLELTLHPTEYWGRLEYHYVGEATCSKQSYKKDFEMKLPRSLRHHSSTFTFLRRYSLVLKTGQSGPLLCSDSKESACNAGDLGLTARSGRSPGEGNGYPLKNSWLENSTDRGARQAIVHGVPKSRTWLSNQHLCSYCFLLSSFTSS